MENNPTLGYPPGQQQQQSVAFSYPPGQQHQQSVALSYPPGQQQQQSVAYSTGPTGPQYTQPLQPGVVQQPPGGAQVQWMAIPQSVAGCPPGLEYLTQVDQLLVHQQVELLEVFTGIETKNKYQVKNSVGQQVYFAQEESGVWMRQCCGPARGFTMHITDNTNQEVIRIVREFKCCAGCGWCACSDCCAFELSVEAPVGQVIGYVRQAQSAWRPRFQILDASRSTIMKIDGPCCICQGICCTWDQNFKLLSNDKMTELGKVSKQWSGLVKELYSKADNFSVSFPMDLDAKMKAVVLAATFLIDFMYFEEQQNNNQ